jgi:dihydrofolate reductase
MSGAVQIQTSMSLDGFIAGPDDDMDWIFDDAAAGDGAAGDGAAGDGAAGEGAAGEGGADVAADVMAMTGAILAGRRTYDVGRRSTRSETSEPYGGGWSGTQFVLTHRPVDDPDVTFLSGDVRRAVEIGLAAAGEKNLAVFGADVGAQCLAVDLVDEVMVWVVPVLLGAGVPLYRSAAPARIRLEEIGSRPLGGATRLHYRVVR